ncbi:hypothetical protein M0R45_028709 [Rubus argutus]|uniref:Pentatricopeptide repeat-containing protein n=1 Tax=Rubus argutus TaxID=59490 RepID=A0AAW1W856_RUBAR
MVMSVLPCLQDGYRDLAMDIGNQFTERGYNTPRFVVSTGIIDEYAEAGKTAAALHVYRMMLDSEYCAPNVYTYSCHHQSAWLLTPTPIFLVFAKRVCDGDDGKGMQPNASTLHAVFEAFAREEKMEEAKQFLEEMRLMGLWLTRKQ